MGSQVFGADDLLRAMNLKVPLIVAPMAGGPSTVELVVASAKAGALGSMGAAYSSGLQIEDFVSQVKARTSLPIAINLFIPHQDLQISEKKMNAAVEATKEYRKVLGLPPPQLLKPYQENFNEQFESVLRAKPTALSFIFGLLEPNYIHAAKREKICLIGTATSFKEALALEETGVDAVVLQGFEAGGHRALFDPTTKDPEIPTFDLLEQCRNKIKIPLIAAGGIMTAADVRKALSRGAQAVQMGTAFLACEEAGTSEPYRRALLEAEKRKTKTTRAFSGRLARGIENRFMLEMEKNPEAILPFPAQNKFTRDLRAASAKKNSGDFLSLWSGSGQGQLWTGSASDLIRQLFF